MIAWLDVVVRSLSRLLVLSYGDGMTGRVSDEVRDIIATVRWAADTGAKSVRVLEAELEAERRDAGLWRAHVATCAAKGVEP